MKYILLVLFFTSCAAKHDYFYEASAGFGRHYDSAMKYMMGKIVGDSVSIKRYDIAQDSMAYYRGAEDYVLKMQYP